MCSTHNVGKPVVVERFTGTIQSLSNQYNHTYHRTIKMKPIDPKASTYIDLGMENNDIWRP